MPDFDYEILDGASVTRKIRGEDLGLDGSNVQIIGHKFKSDEIGAVDDTPATNETGSSTAIALLKGLIRELIKLPLRLGGTTDSAATDQTVQNHSIPKFVFGLKPELIAKFVIDIWEMNGVAEETWYHFTTKNARLATDLQTLLLRLGVRSSIKTQDLKSLSEKTKYQVRLSGSLYCHSPI